MQAVTAAVNDDVVTEYEIIPHHFTEMADPLRL